MTDVEPVVTDFAASGRAGRRNALPDILGSPAGAGTSDLPHKLAKLSVSEGSDLEITFSSRAVTVAALKNATATGPPTSDSSDDVRAARADAEWMTRESELEMKEQRVEKYHHPKARWKVKSQEEKAVIPNT